jgi:HlyD family secretion protein
MRLIPSSRSGRIGLLVTLVIGAAGVAAYSRTGPPDLPTAEVTRGDFIEIVETRGEIKPFRSILVTAPFQAGELQILELAANGSMVKEGDVVAKFDAVTLRRTLQDRQSELRQAQAELDQAREQAKLSEEKERTAVTKAGYDVQRSKIDLADPAVSSGMDVERTKLALGDAEQRLVEAEARDRANRASSKADLSARERKIAKIRGDIEQAERALGSLQVTAPGDGTVSIMPNFRASSPMGPAQEFRAGDRAWPGAQILELPDLTSIHLASRIDEADRGQLRPGQSATIRVDAVPDREYQGSIADISLLARVDFSSGWPPSKNFDLKLALKDADAKIKPGMSAVARIAVGKTPDMLLIPAGAVFTSGGRSVVYRRTDRGFDETPIDIVRRAREQVAVKNGLQPGDRLALTRPDQNGKGGAK